MVEVFDYDPNETELVISQYYSRNKHADKLSVGSLKLFKDFAVSRNIRPGTARSYISTLNLFNDFIGGNLEEFIEDCLREEDDRVPERKKLIKTKLLEYRNHLLNSDMGPNTVKTYFSKVLTFLRHHEIRIPDLPQVKYDKEHDVSYYDLPDKKHILQALDLCDVHLSAIILFMSSSGTAKAETLSLTVGDFIKGCKDYYPEDMVKLNKILKRLLETEMVVPIFSLRRIKTDKDYYTCCSPEASNMIVKSLQARMMKEEVTLNSPLFDYSDSSLLTAFQKINDNLGWGFVGKYRFFRSHALRKYFASNINLTPDLVDAFEGRRRNQIHDTYIKVNPEELREIYKRTMHNVMVFSSESYGWDSIPPQVNTKYKDDERAVITLKFDIPTGDVHKCMNFINNTFYTK